MISKSSFLFTSLLLITWSVSSTRAQDWRYLRLLVEWSAEEENAVEEEGRIGENNLSEAPFIHSFCQERWPICPDIYDPVCITHCIIGDNCKGTAINACQACFDFHVEAYTPGACDVQRTICVQRDLLATEVACTDNYDPVCAYWNDCNLEPCGKTVGNACQACSQGASYHTQGECRTEFSKAKGLK